jgi:hypothetical protein
MYLGPVYGSEEIAKQMPKERNEFQVGTSLISLRSPCTARVSIV